ncbi:MAG: endonuclease/exonuclease/phosphatase family protein [Bifidobacteriaceae bacterium]|nr:endonuclease/exonuclease/phosphatase family protein [Bifidobacteriaceae bacterium]
MTNIIFSLLIVILVLWQATYFLPAGKDSIKPLPYVIALQPFIPLISCLFCLIAALLQAQHFILLIFIIFTLISLLQFLPYFIHKNTQHSHTNSSKKSLNIMSLNCRYGRANVDDIFHTIENNHIEILCLVETTPEFIAKLEQAGIRTLLPYKQLGEHSTDDNGGSNAIFSSYAPVISNANALPNYPAAAIPAITIEIHDSPCSIAAIHTKSPMRSCAQWSQGIMQLRNFHMDNQLVIICGDFNASINHPSFRYLLAFFKDTAINLKKGPLLTFPRWTLFPRIELDHVLFTDSITPVHAKTVTVRDTDHLAVIAQLQFEIIK